MKTIKCGSWITAWALTCLQEWYRLWERDKESKNPRLRQFALLAKTLGIVHHDRYLDIPGQVAAERQGEQS